MNPVTPPGMRPPLPAGGALMDRARELEAVFLSEMLTHAGLDAAGGALGGGTRAGGIGEEQFVSFLRMEQARQLVAAGGIGLAEVLFRAMGGRNEG